MSVVEEQIPSIIVVGPDRVGKTTVVGHLARLAGIPSFKCPSEKQIFRDGGRSSLTFDYNLTHFLQQTGYTFVSDRGYPCERVYSRVFGRQTDDELLEMIDRRHADLGTAIVYLYSSVLPSEEDDLVPKERYWDVVMGYNRFMTETRCRVTAVDTAGMLRNFSEGRDSSLETALEVLRKVAAR